MGENGGRRRVEDTWSIPSLRRWYDADKPAWPAPITTASYTCTVVQQPTGTGYAAPRTGRIGSDGARRIFLIAVAEAELRHSDQTKT